MKTVAVILAAGQGKRMKSPLPKVLHPVLGKPMVQRAAETAVAAGVSEVTVVVGHGREAVISILEQNSWNWAVQNEQLGTAHAVKCASEQIEGADEVVVLMGDVPLLRAETVRELLEARRQHNAALTVLTTTPPVVTGYGRIILNDSGLIDRIVEEKDATEEEKKNRIINTGIMVFDGTILPEILSLIESNNAQNEFYLTDAVAIAGKLGKDVYSHFTEFWTEVAGVNNPLQLAECTKVMKKRVTSEHLLAGVVIPDPDTVWIEDTATIARGVIVGRNCRISGEALIGPDVVIGDGAVIDGVVIEAGTRIDEYSVIGFDNE